MKIFTYFLPISLLLFSACSHDVERYTLSATQERAATSYLSGQIKKDDKIELTFNAIYLNDVYPEYQHEVAQFLVALYSKEPIHLTITGSNQKASKNSYTIRLRKKSALWYKRLEKDDLLIDLMPINSGWLDYYIITFPLDKEKKRAPELELMGDGHKLKLKFKKPYVTKMFSEM